MFDDFQELLSAFNAHRVRYLVVGGYAVSLHASPRATKDLDILISPDAENSKAVYAALAKFGAPLEGLTPKDFTEPDTFFRMGKPPVMVDILPRISGVDFEVAWQRRVQVDISEGLTVAFISRHDLLASKMSAGRAQDLADVAALREGLERGHENSQLHSPAADSRALDEIEQTQARGRRDWLELRRQQADKPHAAPDRSHDKDELTKDVGAGLDDDPAPR